ncbi:MAG: radical SAM protein [Anaerolineae bacterium]|nr:radical SAM protein [Anaerolineae bacterium]
MSPCLCGSDILLVSPTSRVWDSRAHIHMGLGYLAGSLLEHGYRVDIFEESVEDRSLSDRLASASYDVVGISSPTPLIEEAWQSAEVAHRAGAITILGGPHLTLHPGESLEKPQVDLVVRGEAEDTIIEVMRALQRDRGLEGEGGRRFRAEVWGGIAGVSFRDEQGKVVHNPGRSLRQDVDALPWPAYHLFPIERYTNLQPLTDGLQKHARAYTLLTSRGCPYQCIYCSKPITGNTWRARSPERVVEEWAYLVREMRATEIGVTDDVWNLDLDRAKRICHLLIDEGLASVPWVTIHGMRADHTDAELFRLMKRAGCKRVGFGVESGNQAILDSIKKRQKIEDVRAAFANAKAAGLQTMGFFIFGLPGETEETMEDTIRLALELDPDLANFMMADPLPGTELYEMVQREGRLLASGYHDLAIHGERARFEMGDMTAGLVERKFHEAYRRFYFRPRRIWQRATSPDTWRRLPTYVSNFGRFFVRR